MKFTTYCQELFPMLDRLEFVAGHNVTLLLVGETGSGKTTLRKRLVHELPTPRRQETIPHSWPAVLCRWI